MTNQQGISKPEFVYLDKQTELSNRILEEDIFDKPFAYNSLLDQHDLISTFDREHSGPNVSGEVARKLGQFFTERHDRDIDFDKATEIALGYDKKNISLLLTHRKLTNSAEATKTRDAIRQHRLGFFVHRVIVWEGLTSQSRNKHHLRSTG